MAGWTCGLLLLSGPDPLTNKVGVAIDDSRRQVKAEWEASCVVADPLRLKDTVRLLSGERRACP